MVKLRKKILKNILSDLLGSMDREIRIYSRSEQIHRRDAYITCITIHPDGRFTFTCDWYFDSDTLPHCNMWFYTDDARILLLYHLFRNKSNSIKLKL